MLSGIIFSSKLIFPIIIFSSFIYSGAYIFNAQHNNFIHSKLASRYPILKNQLYISYSQLNYPKFHQLTKSRLKLSGPIDVDTPKENKLASSKNISFNGVIDCLIEYSQSLLYSEGIPRQEAAQAIIQLGSTITSLPDERNIVFRDLFQKAPGCISEIKLYAELLRENNSILVHGMADSLFGKGFLEILSKSLCIRNSSLFVLKNTFVDEFCEVPFIKYLPSSRMIGIFELLKIIQNQIKEQLNISKLRIVQRDDPYYIHQSKEYSNSKKSSKSVAMLLSGGVDSSVSMYLLKEQGYDVDAFYLKIWLEDEGSFVAECPWKEDISYCEETCKLLGVPLQIIPLQKEYKDTILQYTLNEARRGRTPNPDVMCNSMIKFGVFYELIGRHYPYIASGHYAKTAASILQADESPKFPLISRITDMGGPVCLQKSFDTLKDQTYFLSSLRNCQLQKVLFPIGGYTKSKVRDLALARNLPSSMRKDSQGLCFLGKIKYEDFVSHHLGKNPGDVIDIESKKIIGKHKGLWMHTIGQHRGIGSLLSFGRLSDMRWIVVAKDMTSNILFVSANMNLVNIEKQVLALDSINWISGIPAPLLEHGSCSVDVKLKHGPELYPATLYLSPDLDHQSYDLKEALQYGPDSPLRLVLNESTRLTAEGQFVVIYSGSVCLGSGIIQLSQSL